MLHFFCICLFFYVVYDVLLVLIEIVYLIEYAVDRLHKDWMTILYVVRKRIYEYFWSLRMFRNYTTQTSSQFTSVAVIIVLCV